MPPALVGLGETHQSMVLGKLSGRNAFNSRLKALGYTLSKEHLTTAFVAFKTLADSKTVIEDEDLQQIVNGMLSH